MGTTTFEAVRSTQLSLVEGLTPTLLNTVKFVRHRSEQDFRLWCTENTQACFRRFAIVDLWEYEPPQVTNNDVEFVEGRQDVLIAYPEDFRFGGDNLRDLRDLMRADQYLIDNSLGHRGTGNYTDAHAVLESAEHDDAEGVSFLSLTYVFRFYRSV
jgi:hypothetical protein